MNASVEDEVEDPQIGENADASSQTFNEESSVGT